MTATTYRIALWGSIVAAIILVVGGLIALAMWSEKKQDNLVAPGVSEITPEDHIFGEPSASVTLVEYGDFQCPACGMYYPIVSAVVNDYVDKMRFVFRNFPLTQHPNARPAAYAAEAAALQGKYVEMFEEIYATQGEWTNLTAANSRKKFEEYAQRFGLDMDKYKNDVSSDAVRTKVDADVKSGVNAGVNSTPTFYLNGRRITPTSYDEFKLEIDAALAADATNVDTNGNANTNAVQ